MSDMNEENRKSTDFKLIGKAPSSYKRNVRMLDDLLDIELGHEHSRLKPRMTLRVIAGAIAIACYKTARPNHQDHVS